MWVSSCSAICYITLSAMRFMFFNWRQETPRPTQLPLSLVPYSTMAYLAAVRCCRMLEPACNSHTRTHGQLFSDWLPLHTSYIRMYVCFNFLLFCVLCLPSSFQHSISGNSVLHRITWFKVSTFPLGNSNLMI